VSAASAVGSRTYQEDRAVHQWIHPRHGGQGSGWLLAVFDGHRGAATADKAARAVVPAFELALRSRRGDVLGALGELFQLLEHLTHEDVSGSTASVAYIRQEAPHAYIAVLGDSPVALLDAEGRLHVAPEHNVRTNLAERAAAEARGAVYEEGYIFDFPHSDSGLQMARTLGDSDLSRILNREPEIEAVPLGKEGCVLVGTDGLLSPGAGDVSEQLARLMDMIRRGSDAQALVEDAVGRRTGDNVTALVWRNISEQQAASSQ
jgi:serine/threonine protein phosphatase PrpC